MLSLRKSNAFQKDYSNWKQQISEITDNEQVHKELSRLLNELVSQVNFLDNQHLDLSTNNRLSAQSSEAKTRIVELRKQIDKRLDEYKKSQKNS